MTLELVRSKAEEVLGFNPYSTEYNVFIVEMTPLMAQYILDHLNNDNRKVVESQLAAIRKSAGTHGWLWDGGACIFTTKGNLLEFQHRLKIIVERGDTVKTIIVTGVDPSVFHKAAPAKNRTVTDVINKQDKTATSDEVTTLRQLLKRRAGQDAQAKGAPTLTMTNAVEQWEIWKTYIRRGMNVTSDFFDGRVKQFSPWERQFNAWATLMVYIGKEDVARNFLNLFKDYLAYGVHSTLCKEMKEFFLIEDVGFLAGEKKAAIMHIMLCHATDRFLIAPDGAVQYDLDFSKASHSGMLNKGTYRDFLINAQGIKNFTVI